MKNLKSFFTPKSIAIVGASLKKGKLGNVLAENIRKDGWKGRLYFVNPKHAKNSRNFFASLKDIKKPVDLVLIAIPAPFVNQAIEEGALAKPSLRNFVVISSGFKESGKEGKILEENLAVLAEKHNLNILGPNCLGFANPSAKLNATFTDVKLRKGGLAIVSQSGALAVALLDWADKEKIGFSKIISIGNKTVLDESDILNFLEKDPETKAISLYLEDIKSGQSFLSAFSKITPRKPVIVFKAGKTAAGQKAVSSHTGSLAQDQDIVDAVFEKLNIIQANNVEEFQDLIYFLNFNPTATKNEVIVVTNAGGPGVMASDFVGKSKNIRLLNFQTDFKNRLKEDLPPSASVENPIDVIGDASPERYQKVLEKISQKFPNRSIVVILTPQNQTDPARVAQILAKMKKKIPNISACFMGGEKIALAKDILKKNRIPNFDNPERVLAAIEKLSRYSSAKSSGTVQFNILQKSSMANAMFKKALAENRKMLFWKEAEKLFSKYGVKLARSVSFEDIKDLKNKKISFPCALKTDDPKIAHRLEKNAVTLDIKDENELKAAFGRMKKATKAEHFLIQPMVDPGLELIIGMKRDPSFGPIVICGLGGSFTEIFRDRVIFVPPLTQQEIANKLSKLAIFPILKGFRGKSGYDITQISRTIKSVAEIAFENPGISEIDINPLVAYNNGKANQILDAKIFIK